MRKRITPLFEFLVLTLLATRGSTKNTCRAFSGNRLSASDAWCQSGCNWTPLSAGKCPADVCQCTEEPVVQVDCVLSEGSWSACSSPCGRGTKSRDRKRITEESSGGKTCTQVMGTGSTGWRLGQRNGRAGRGTYFRETRSCHLKACPVNCAMGDWSRWTDCSPHCGQGEQSRFKMRIRAAQNDGKACPESLARYTGYSTTYMGVIYLSYGNYYSTNERECDNEPCPDCEWKTRREKGDCIGVCGEGLMNVTLVTVVTKEAEGDGKPCNETHVIKETCDTGVSCPASALVLGTSIGSAVLLLIGCSICLVAFFMRKKRTKNPPTTLEAVPNNIEEQASTSFMPAQPVLFKELNLPAHNTLKKDSTLQEKVKELAGNQKVLDSEFNRLVDFVEKDVVKESNVAKAKENKTHNRYVDIVPFDDNYITLASKMFQTEDETSYINASRIVFTGCSQAFIAAQAPKPIGFNHFWHMVIEDKVNVIVMITRLVEKKKLKAHQYWPDSEGKEVAPVLDIGGGCKVEHVSTSYQGTYFLRKFTVWLADGGSREVTQLHTENWPDLEAPEDPKVLVDMVFRVHKMQQTNPGPILVHCSAGVGRTGTFLALYKLWLDYMDERVTILSLLPTVVALRRQRCFMVQRTPQYRYVAKCLSFMVSVEEGTYYE